MIDLQKAINTVDQSIQIIVRLFYSLIIVKNACAESLTDSLSRHWVWEAAHIAIWYHHSLHILYSPLSYIDIYNSFKGVILSLGST